MDIKSKTSNQFYTLHESASLGDMQNQAYHFFKNRHGQREVFEAYRGFIFASATINKVRRHSVYLFTGKDAVKCNNLVSKQDVDNAINAKEF